ncbi:ABC transporter substrate-binding protein [Comamonadaceae bacterium OTU4NAUVB1]|jgi:NitT/TauT family transport system substrate-binding protein|nr:ABC transporter substrate-binding protein [Comamonadaceae bacterium OTU4NAUVB1]
MTNRRTFLHGTAAVLGAASLAMPGVRAQARLEKGRIAMAVGGKAAFYHLPLTVSQQLGYFQDEGLDVEVTDFAGGARALQAVIGGTADVGAGAYEHTINLQSKGQVFQSIVMQARAPQIAVGVSTRTLAGYRGVADLRGRKIGVSAPGASTHMVASLFLSRAGLHGADVSYVGVGVAAGALAAMRAGQIDAISNIDPVMTMLEQKGDVKILCDTRTQKGTLDLFGGPMPASCVYAPIEFVQKNPRTCQAIANAVVRGLKWLQTAGPGDIIKTVPEAYLLGDRALYLSAFDKMREAISVDGLVPPDGPRTALAALTGFDPAIQGDRVDLDKTYTNRFAQRAKDRFHA